MSFALATAVAGTGTVSCTGTTTVTGTGTNFGAAGSTARVGGTITVGGVTKNIVAITSTTSLTTDTAFGTFTAQSYTGVNKTVQTGADTMSTSMGAIAGFTFTNRGDQQRVFDCQGLDLQINGVLTVDSTTARLQNNQTTNFIKIISTGSASAELIINGQKATANNGPFPYVGFDWLGINGAKIMSLEGTATYPAKLTLKDACIRFGADWLTTYSTQYSIIKTEGDICWMLCASGSGSNQGRLRLENPTASLNFTAKKTYVGVWLNMGVPQTSMKGFTPIYTDGPEINAVSITVAQRIPIEDYDTTYVTPSYYPGSQMTLYAGSWVRLKNNLKGTNISWQSQSPTNRNVLEFSKQITGKAQDALGNLLSDGYMYYQPVGANVAGVRAKGGTTDITFDLSAKTIQFASGSATSEFVYAWGYANTVALFSAYNYFCTGTTRGAETHTVYSSRYGYDKIATSVALYGNSDAIPTFVHLSKPTSDKVIATAAAITGVSFDFGTKIMTISGNITYQQIYDAYQYALNTTANLFIADDCVVTNGTSNYSGWTINLLTGVTVSTGTGNFTKIQANTITLNGTAKITGIYTTTVGTSTVLELNTLTNGYSLCIYKSDGTTKYFGSNLNAGSYPVYFAPHETGTYYLAAENYGQKRTADTLVLSGGNVWYNITDLEDVGITDTKTNVAAYATLSTTSQIYDATAYFRLTETGIKLGQLVARDGLYLDFGTYNVKIKDDATAIVGVATNTITYKSLVINETTKYNAMKATPPATITPTDTEIINVIIEDANGDSQLTILGGDNLGYELWKVTTSTPTDDYATGTLLTTLATNATPYRFIGISGYDIVGRDISSGVRRRSSMLKGVYTQAFYVGNQIQLASDAPQLVENNQKLDELILKVDTLDTGLGVDLNIINEGVQKASLFIPHTDNI